uniref:Immunoglobulin domain-containing protein n=1 Tax=Amphiprion ocellaris TaxID=80972 RepID=A0AAQ5Z054_AMPOC
MSRRQRKAKHRTADLSEELCAVGFGSSPVLTSSGAGTQMYGSPVVVFRASQPNSVDCIDFHSVTWYQLVNGQRFGIIKKRKRDQAPQMYNFARNVSFGENYSLFLPRVKPADSGTYVCGIGANVGGQSQYPTVDLTVNECVTQADPTSQVVVLSPTKAMNTTQSIQVQELPIMWTTAGYVAVALVKIVLSLISIWVLRISFSRKQQRRRCS